VKQRIVPPEMFRKGDREELAAKEDAEPAPDCRGISPRPRHPKEIDGRHAESAIAETGAALGQANGLVDGKAAQTHLQAKCGWPPAQ